MGVCVVDGGDVVLCFGFVGFGVYWDVGVIFFLVLLCFF